jgi:stage II sporulation protein D
VGLALAVVLAAAVPAVLPSSLAVEVLGREAPREVQLNGAAGVTCDGRTLEAAGGIRLSWTPGAVVLGGNGGVLRRCKRVQLVSAAEGHVSRGGSCGSRAGLALEADRVRRCYGGTLRVAAGARALRLVLQLPLESYVASVVASEAGDAPPEAQAAQAVVTRTWALAHLRRHGDADACDLTHCQLFRGEWTEGSGRAAARTEGQVLRRGDALLPAYFHAACGGHTASSRAVFGGPGPEAVPDAGPDGRPWCAEPSWEFTVPRARLARALGLGAKGGVRVVERTPDGRALEVEAFGRRLPGPLFVARVGRALGFGTLRSTRFRVESDGARLHFRGEGRGHGVGFCQAGASARARAGQRWPQLLEAYLPGAEVTRAGRAISPLP